MASIDCDMLDLVINTKLDNLEGEERESKLEMISKAMELKKNNCKKDNSENEESYNTENEEEDNSNNNQEEESGGPSDEEELETFSNMNNTSGNGFKLDINLILKSVFFGAVFYLLSIPEVYKMTKKCCKSVDGVLLHSIVFALIYYVVVHFI